MHDIIRILNLITFLYQLFIHYFTYPYTLSKASAKSYHWSQNARTKSNTKLPLPTLSQHMNKQQKELHKQFKAMLIHICMNSLVVEPNKICP